MLRMHHTPLYTCPSS